MIRKRLGERGQEKSQKKKKKKNEFEKNLSKRN